MQILTSKIKDAVTQWKNQAGNLKTNQKAKIYFTLPEFNKKQIVN